MLRDIGFQGGEWIVGMDFPANSMPSLYSPEDVFGVVVRARLDLLVRQGYRLIAIVNGHGAENHIAVLERLAREYTASGPARVMHLLAFTPEATGEYKVGHADALETALMLALDLETVDLTTLPPSGEPLRNVDWAIVDAETFDGQPTTDHTVAPHNDPRRVDAAQGETSLDQSTLWIAEQIRAALKAL
jgi:creatinine amidohydrolase/Fe(II)-dependent formamide hydrolase-like protein